MSCLACASWFAGGPLCPSCTRGLRTAPERVLDGGMIARAPFVHDGAARRLVHRLKYHGQSGVAHLLARAMAPLVPDAAEALVPIPRAKVRRWRHGVDPAFELATALGRLTGMPVVAALRSDLWWPRHAAADRSGRRDPGFEASPELVEGMPVLVDDVLTTGATAIGAARLLSKGFPALVTATSVGTLGTRSQAWLR
ncbi:MAG: hypothetical protein KJN71_03635 [Acidimicrobiia bacterium]|nr:hypothetical protein [Acidimicrobiia bacterium]